MGRPRKLPAGWERLSRPGDKTSTHWRHRSGWQVRHCGHPTANYPYHAEDPAHPGILVVERDGRGFRNLAQARAAVEGVEAGTHESVEGPPSNKFGRVFRVHAAPRKGGQ